MLVAYHGALEAPFLWDDRQLILEDVIERPRPLLDHVFQPFWAGGAGRAELRGFFRPVTTLSFALDARWSGQNPVGFHLTNLMLHVAIVCGVYWLARRLGARQNPALLATLAFGLAPRLTESVTWISGRTDLLAAFFGIYAVCLYPLRTLEAEPARPWLRRSVGALLLALALGAKEVALAFVALVLADEVLGALRDRRRASGALLRLLPLALAISGYFALRLYVVGGTKVEAPEISSRLLIFLQTVGRYASMLVDFARPRSQIGDVHVHEYGFAALGGACLIAIVALLLRAGRRSRTASPTVLPSGLVLGLVLAMTAIAPVLHLTPLPVGVIAADRFLYVPLIGLAVAGASAGSLASARTRAAAAVVAAYCALSFVATLARNRDYRSELAFWLEAVRTSPDESSLPLHELAGVYYRANEFEPALGLYARAAERNLRRFKPTPRLLAEISNDLSGALSGLGRYDEALALSEKMLARGFGTPREVFNAGLVHLHRGEFEPARVLTERAIALFPEYGAARKVLASIPDLERRRAEIPRLAGAALNLELARYYRDLGARPEAEKAYLDLLAHSPPREVTDEALSFLLMHGDTRAIGRAVEATPVEDPALAAALLARLELGAELRAAQPIISPYLSSYDPARLGL